MPSVTLYNSFKRDLGNGSIDWDTDSFKIMLCSSTYTPNIDAHTKRSDITNEVTGTNWAAGGVALSGLTVTQDNTNDRASYDANDVSVATTTISNARYGVIYKSRGGLASADELVGYVNFDTDRSTVAATFAITWDANGVFTAA